MSKYELKSHITSLMAENEFIKRKHNISKLYFDTKNPSLFTEVQVQMNYLSMHFLNSIIIKNVELKIKYRHMLTPVKDISLFLYIKLISEILNNPELLSKFKKSALNTISNEIKHTIQIPDYALKQYTINFYNYYIELISRATANRLITQSAKINTLRKGHRNQGFVIPIKDAFIDASLRIKGVNLRRKMTRRQKLKHYELLIDCTVKINKLHSVKTSENPVFGLITVNNETYETQLSNGVNVIRLDECSESTLNIHIDGLVYYKNDRLFDRNEYSIRSDKGYRRLITVN